MGNTHWHTPQPTSHGGIGQKAVCEQSVDAEQVRSADIDGSKIFHDVLNRFLMVEDHHRFLPLLSGGLLPESDQTLGFEKVVLRLSKINDGKV
jgi:hypothetical protein